MLNLDITLDQLQKSTHKFFCKLTFDNFLEVFPDLNLVSSEQVSQVREGLQEFLAVVVLEEDDDEELALEVSHCNPPLPFSVSIDAVQRGGLGWA